MIPENIKKEHILKAIEKTARPGSRNWVATVILQSNGKYSNDERLKALSQIVELVAKETDGDSVILFPCGWFDANKQEARSLYKWAEKNVRKILAKNKGNIVICLGIDGKYDEGKDQSKDQIAIAISKHGIRAIGRKFHPTKAEEAHIKTAKNHSSMEEGKPRIFSSNGKKYFLAVCYDVFGIKQKKIPNFGIDVILDLVHGFAGGYGKGHPYFAKDGFAGASKEWDCLVFGAAVFFHPIKPKNWPSGVYWNKGNKSIRKWKYEDNPIKPIKIKELPNIKEGIASIRIYNFEGKQGLIPDSFEGIRKGLQVTSEIRPRNLMEKIKNVS